MTKWKWSSVWDILKVFEKKIFCRIIQSISVISNSKCIYTACTIKSFSSIVLKLIFFLLQMTYHTVKKPRIGEYIIPGTTVIWQAMQLTETHQPAQERTK